MTWGSFRTMCKRAFGGGLKHGARACGERVCPIRFDQGIGAIDRKTCLSPAAHRRAGASPRRADAHHRLPDHHLPRRLRAGDRPEPAKARRDEARPLRAHRPAGRTPRPPRLRPAGPRRQYRAAAEPAARPDSGLGRRRRPPRHHHRRRSPRFWPASRSKAALATAIASSTSSARRNCSPPPASRASSAT